MSRETDLQSIYFLSNAGIVIIFSYLVLFLEERGLGESQIGYLAVSASIAMVLSNTIFGRLSDTIGRRPFLLIGLISSSISSILYLLPENYYEFVIVRVLNGIALGIFPSAIVGVASDRKLKLGKLTAFGSIGWATGGLVGGYISDLWGLAILFFVSAGLYLMSFLLAVLAGTGHKDQRVKEMTAGGMYKKSIRKNWMIYLTLIFRHGTANSIWIFWALFLRDDLHLSNTQIGVIQATNMLTQFVLMRTVTDRINPRWMVITGGLSSALAFWSFTVVTNFWQMVLTQVILGFSWAMFYVGGLRTVEMRSKEEGIVATSTGLFNASISASQVVGPFLAIYLYAISSGYTLSMDVAAVVTIFATFAFSIASK